MSLAAITFRCGLQLCPARAQALWLSGLSAKEQGCTRLWAAPLWLFPLGPTIAEGVTRQGS